jgi:photosystem II stability/assembly factor-like uncharacterized protein
MGGSFDLVSDQTGVAWNGTNFYITTDSAQTWSIVAPDVRFSDSFSGMDFVSPKVGYVLTNDGSGAYGLYASTDGAATWNTLSR